MANRLADRLAAARRKQFVGREAEKKLFCDALAAAEPPFSLLFIHGPGGVGKSSLLREYLTLAQQAEALAVYLDGRSFDASPSAFLATLNRTLGTSADEDCFSLLERRTQKFILLIDTFEALTNLDGWLRDYFLPQIPVNSLVVFAGRRPPSEAWRTDSGWQDLLRTLSLRNLKPEESRELLQRHTIPPEAQEEIITFTHGHPLAISLVTDLAKQGGDIRLTSSTHPDIVHQLLQRLVSEAPSYQHKLSLEACAMVRYMTEGLLAAMLENTDVYEIFDWLRKLSFIESGHTGLFPHDLVRDAIVSDVRWRNPDLYRHLNHRARSYYQRRIQETHGNVQRRLLTDLFFLHRDNVALRPYFDWRDRESMWIDSARASDFPFLIELIRKHEGEQSAQLAAFWFERQPEVTWVVRNSQQRPLGMVMFLALHRATEDEIHHDPATRVVWQYLQQTAFLRPNEQATFFRFWMDEAKYQALSAVQSRVFLACVQHYLTTPGLAFTIFPCAYPEHFETIFAYADLQRTPQADFEIEGRAYGVYCHDWRLLPPLAWLDLLAQREVAVANSRQTTHQATVPTPATPHQLLVLSEPEFAEAVRDALRHFTQINELGRNALVRSRLVIESCGANAVNREKAEALQKMILDAAKLLQAAPKTNRAYRALHHTYLQPAATQEIAAELLDLPFSTYRRHLKEGIDHVIEVLWNGELGNE